MSIRHVVIVPVVAAALLVGAAVVQNAAGGQSKPAAQAKKVMKLTAEDYIEIQQLVVRYSHTLDGDSHHASPNPEAHADLFTDDATFRMQSGEVVKGRAELLKHGGLVSKRWRTVSHITMDHRIEPTADGAVGQQYLLLLDSLGKNKDGRAIYAVRPYRYEDVYVKTPTGWRFKSRNVYLAEELTAQP